MKKIGNVVKTHKNLWIFLIIILTFGIGVGIYFGITSASVLDNTLNNYITNSSSTHFSLNHFTILSIILISSFLLIGIPLAISYLFYEGMSLGFCLTLFIINFQLKGFLYIIIFFLLIKIVFLIIYFFFISKILNIGKNILSWIIYKNNKKEQIIHLSIGCFVLILLLFCYDLFIDFIGIKLIHNFNFLLL